MNKRLLIIAAIGLSAATAFSQGSKGRTGSNPATSLAQDTAPPKNTKSVNGNNNSAQTRTTSTTTLGNTTPKRNGAQERVSANGTSSKTPSRPATYAPPTNSYASKGGIGATQSASVLKPAERGVVNWMTLEQALEKSKTEKRKIFVDMYTDWCGWCKHMDSTTFVHPAVAKYLNEHFYPVKFNAEQEKDIVFKDKTYHFKKSGTRGYHELAALWLNNRLSFPTVVFLDENQQLIQPVPGYQDAAKMEAIINYFGSDSHKKTPWETYEKNFRK
jgi:thioredoxin-related protein